MTERAWTYGQTFELTEDHLKLLSVAYVNWQYCETGAPEIDPKRPYGNSSVGINVMKVLEWKIPRSGPKDLIDRDNPEYEELETKAYRVHSETLTALQIVLQLRTFEPGTYRFVSTKSWEKPKWERVK